MGVSSGGGAGARPQRPPPIPPTVPTPTSAETAPGGEADASASAPPALTPPIEAGAVSDCGTEAPSDDGAQPPCKLLSTMALAEVAGSEETGQAQSGPSSVKEGSSAIKQKKKKGNKERRVKGTPQDAPSPLRPSAAGAGEAPAGEPGPAPAVMSAALLTGGEGGLEVGETGVINASPVSQLLEMGGKKTYAQCVASGGLTQGAAEGSADLLVTSQATESGEEACEMEIQLSECRKRPRERDDLSPPKKAGLAPQEPDLDLDDQRRLMGLDIEGVDVALPASGRPRRSSVGNVQLMLAAPPGSLLTMGGS